MVRHRCFNRKLFNVNALRLGAKRGAGVTELLQDVPATSTLLRRENNEKSGAPARWLYGLTPKNIVLFSSCSVCHSIQLVRAR